jgi:hypothetical protein
MTHIASELNKRKSAMMRKRTGFLLLAVSVWALAMGCTTLTYENWNAIPLQATKPDVRAVLGEPTGYAQEDRWMYHDPERQVIVTFEFMDSQVLNYTSWSDPVYGPVQKGTPSIGTTDTTERKITTEQYK